MARHRHRARLGDRAAAEAARVLAAGVDNPAVLSVDPRRATLRADVVVREALIES